MACVVINHVWVTRDPHPDEVLFGDILCCMTDADHRVFPLRAVDFSNHFPRTQCRHSSQGAIMSDHEMANTLRFLILGPETGNLHRMTFIFGGNQMTTSLFGDSIVSFGLNGLLLLKLRIWIRGSHFFRPNMWEGMGVYRFAGKFDLQPTWFSRILIKADFWSCYICSVIFNRLLSV